jgi:hypothetical protein
MVSIDVQALLQTILLNADLLTIKTENLSKAIDDRNEEISRIQKEHAEGGDPYASYLKLGELIRLNNCDMDELHTIKAKMATLTKITKNIVTRLNNGNIETEEDDEI